VLPGRASGAASREPCEGVGPGGPKATAAGEAAASATLGAMGGADAALPDTLTFVDAAYQGQRYAGQVVAVFGGSSGIGFASAAQFRQECARGVVLVARNVAQAELAAQRLRLLSVAHCASPGRVEVLRADVRERAQVKAAFAAIGERFGGELDVVFNTAGLPGYLAPLHEVPDDVFFSKFDAVWNNVYGSVFIAAEALRFWNVSSTSSSSPEVLTRARVRRGGRLPALLHMSSEEAFTACSGCEMYGVSKSGIVALSRALAGMYEGQVTSTVIAPGLVDTPLTWNQIRGSRIVDGQLEQVDDLQTFMCYGPDNKTIIRDGTCPTGGSGLGCPCPDERRGDPRIPLKFGPHLWPAIDPRSLASLALFLASPHGETFSGSALVVDNNFTTRGPRPHRLVKRCPMSMVELCPEVSIDAPDDPNVRDTASAGPGEARAAPQHRSIDVYSLLIGVIIGLLLSRLLQPRRHAVRGDKDELHSSLLPAA
jgi:NAD(P)-dependent dehydrogenase (short-subunit alcohol dehydrogenase family)